MRAAHRYPLAITSDDASAPTATPEHDEGIASWTRTQRLTVLAAGVGVFMIFLDALIVNVALPDIQSAFGVGESGLQWAVTAYSIGMAVLMMASASLSDRHGRKRTYVVGVSVFAAASLVAGLAPNMEILSAARFVQGMAAATTNVTSLALVSAAFPDAKARVRAIGMWTAIGSVGVALGPTVGGVLTELVSWRAVFFVNLPAAALGIVITIRHVEESRDPADRTLDLPGQALFAVAVTTLAYGVIQGQSTGWTSPLIVGCFVAFVASMAGFIVRELRTDDPMMDLGLFRQRPYAIAIGTIFLAFFCGYGMLLLVTQYFQNVRDFSPIVAGLLILPFSVSMLLISPRAGKLAGSIGYRKPVILGQTLMLTGMGAIAAAMWIGPLAVAVGIGWMAAGLALLVTPVTGLAMTTVPPDRAGMASGIMSTQRAIGSTAGYAVLGAVLVLWLSVDLDGSLTTAIPDDQQREAVAEVIIDQANPAAYAAEIGPGEPITTNDPSQDAEILAAADESFVQGIQLALVVAMVLAAGVLVLLVAAFREPTPADG